MRIDRRLLGTLVILALTAGVGAQGLGDAATREAERRKAAQQKAAPVKSYSDQDLPSSQAASPVAEEAAEDTVEPGGEAVAEGSPQGGSVIGGLPTARSGKTVKAASSTPSGSSSRSHESSSSESYGSNPGSEASWRSAASGARRRIQDAEKRVQELDKKAASLMYAPTGDCNVGSSARIMTTEELKNYKCVDPVAQWEGERRRTLDALEQAKADLEKARKDQETMQESARKQGALPGWLRE